MNSKHIAWFIPIAYLLHLLDEYYSGGTFPNWISGTFDIHLSAADFILINSIGFITVLVIILLYNIDKISHFLPAALGVLFFVNGIIHPATGLLTSSYSPGTITGLVVYIPLGFLVFKHIFPILTEKERVISAASGIAINFIVFIIAFKI